MVAQSHSPPWQPGAALRMDTPTMAMDGFQEAPQRDQHVPLPTLSCCPWLEGRQMMAAISDHEMEATS